MLTLSQFSEFLKDKIEIKDGISYLRLQDVYDLYYTQVLTFGPNSPPDLPKFGPNSPPDLPK